MLTGNMSATQKLKKNSRENHQFLFLFHWKFAPTSNINTSKIRNKHNFFYGFHKPEETITNLNLSGSLVKLIVPFPS